MRKVAKVCLAMVVVGAVVGLALFGAMIDKGTASTPIPATSAIRDNKISIDGYYLLKESATNETLNVTCILYLTNRWNDSGDIRIVAYVMDWKRLAQYKTDIEIGSIDTNKTEEVAIPIVLRKDSRKIDVLIFEDGLLKMKGYIYLEILYKPILYNISIKDNDLLEAWNCRITSSSFPSIPHPIEIARTED